MTDKDLYEGYKNIHSICAANDNLFTRLYFHIDEASKEINPQTLLPCIFNGEEIKTPLIIDMTHCLKLLVENNKRLLEEVKSKDIYNNSDLSESLAKMSLEALTEKLDMWLRKITKLENSIIEKHFKDVELPPFLEELHEESRRRVDEALDK